MSKTNWTRIKIHLLPSIMQEIDIMENKYCELVNKLKNEQTQGLIDYYLQLRKDISERIEELENYLDDNFGVQRMLILEKGVFKLKRLLFYNPDINNELEESDLQNFRGISVNLHEVEKNNYEAQQFSQSLKEVKSAKLGKVPQIGFKAKNLNRSKVPEKRETYSSRGREENYGTNNKSLNASITPMEDYKTTTKENKNTKDMIIKKKLVIKLTDEEYKILLKLKARKNAKYL